MFVAIAILSSLVTGTQVAIFVLSIRNALILDIDDPLSEKLELVKKAVWNLYIIVDWTGNIAVSMIVSICHCSGITYLRLMMLREDVTQRSHRHLEGLGPIPISTAANPPTVYSVDRSRG